MEIKFLKNNSYNIYSSNNSFIFFIQLIFLELINVNTGLIQIPNFETNEIIRLQ